MEYRLLCLYTDMLDLYGDRGNIEILKYRLKKRDINVIIDYYHIGNKPPKFNSYDLVYIGGGADLEQSIVAKDLHRHQVAIKESINQGVFYLLICGAYQLFGKYYKDANNKVIDGLGLFDYYTIASLDHTKRCIGNITIEVNLNNEIIPVFGFENHGGETFGIKSPLGKVIQGQGNHFNDKSEGLFLNNLIGTYLHGPFLSKNPMIADYIIQYGLSRKYQYIHLKKLDDEFETRCKEQLIKTNLH